MNSYLSLSVVVNVLLALSKQELTSFGTAARNR
jgi:hypothetical protein